MTHRYTGENDFYKGAGDEVLAPGDETEFEDGPPDAFSDRFEEVGAESSSDAGEGGSSEQEDESPSEEEEMESTDAEPAENGDGEESDSELPVDLSLNVPQIEAELEAGDFTDAELDALESAEESGDDRTGVKEAIEEAR